MIISSNYLIPKHIKRLKNESVALIFFDPSWHSLKPRCWWCPARLTSCRERPEPTPAGCAGHHPSALDPSEWCHRRTNLHRLHSRHGGHWGINHGENFRGYNEQRKNMYIDVWVCLKTLFYTVYTPFYGNSWWGKWWGSEILEVPYSKQTPRVTRGNKQQGRWDSSNFWPGRHSVGFGWPHCGSGLAATGCRDHYIHYSAQYFDFSNPRSQSLPCICPLSSLVLSLPRYSTPFQPGFFWRSSCTRRFFFWGRPVTHSGLDPWRVYKQLISCSSGLLISQYCRWKFLTLSLWSMEATSRAPSYMASFSGRSWISRKMFCTLCRCGPAPSKHGHSWPWTSIFSNSISTSSGSCSKMSARVTASTSIFLGSLPTHSPLKTLPCPGRVRRRLLHSCKGWT